LRVLVIDDEQSQRELLSGFLRKKGFEVFEASDGQQGLNLLNDSGAEAALVDIQMPNLDGMAFIKKALELNPDLGIIIMTAFGTVESAIKAMKDGAYDFLLKPLDLDHIILTLNKIRENQRILIENRYLKRKLEKTEGYEQIIGDSEAIKKLHSEISRIAPSDASVLIRGESGTGKELVARAIHYASPKSGGPFLAINCTSLPETLLESELFGHEKGAFTGAVTRHLGRFELSHNGTIFLDEIGDISPVIQAKLLRVLENKTFQRLGGEKDITVNVRIVAATNRDLEKKISDGQFREDLFYRLNVLPIFIPPLRQRKDDILLLVSHFIEKFNRRNNKNIKGITPKAKDLLLSYSWPGNVRELENLIERAVVLCYADVIDTTDIDPFLNTIKEVQIGVDLNLENLEKRAIAEALKRSKGNQIKAAEILGIHRNTLRLKLEKYKLNS